MDRNEENLLVLWILLLRRVTSNRVYCKVNTIKKIMKKKNWRKFPSFSREHEVTCALFRRKKNEVTTRKKRGTRGGKLS